MSENFTIEIGGYVIGKTSISYFARTLFGMLATGLLTAASNMARNLSNTRVLIIHRKDAAVMNIFYALNVEDDNSSTVSNGNLDERNVVRIKITEEKTFLFSFVGFGTVAILSILLMYFAQII